MAAGAEGRCAGPGNEWDRDTRCESHKEQIKRNF